jgi:hypothetical protein
MSWSTWWDQGSASSQSYGGRSVVPGKEYKQGQTGCKKASGTQSKGGENNSGRTLLRAMYTLR